MTAPRWHLEATSAADIAELSDAEQVELFAWRVALLPASRRWQIDTVATYARWNGAALRRAALRLAADPATGDDDRFVLEALATELERFDGLTSPAIH
jgi:hypothetical protein